MAAMPEDQAPTTAQLIMRSYAKPDAHRMHLGASLIGDECARKTWLTWRWAETERAKADDPHQEDFGRSRRLFRTGDLEEPRLIEDLRRIGVEVQDRAPNGSQWRVRTFGGHFGGSMDGAGLGVPEAPKTWHVLEFKTASAKNFAKIEKDGVKKAKPEHHGQMMVYMGLTGMERALYLVKNKDTDAIYSERVRFDKAEFERLTAKARSILLATEPPERISKDPSFWKCGWCKFKPQCHGQQVPEVNCRTCAHSTPDLTGPDTEEGRWLCSNEALKSAPVLSEALQRTGCAGHRFIPIFLERVAKPVDFIDGDVIYQTVSGNAVFANGEGVGSLSSQEIRNCGSKAALPEMCAIKAEFKGAKVVA